jgi:hypothetical protein
VTSIEKNSGPLASCSQPTAVFEVRRQSVRWSDWLFFDAVEFPWSDLGGSLRLPHPESATRNGRSGWNRLLPTRLAAIAIQWHRSESLFSARIRQPLSTLVASLRRTQLLHIGKSCGGVKVTLSEIRKLPRTERHSDQIRFKFTVVGITGLSALTILARRMNQTAFPRVLTPMETSHGR